MNHEILYKPSYAMLRVEMEPGESVLAEAGAMVAMAPSMQVKTLLNTSHGAKMGFFKKLWSFFVGLFIAMARKVLGGESFFVNRYWPEGGKGDIYLSPAVTGDIIHYPLTGNKVYIQASSYIASTGDVQMKLKFTGLKGLLSGEGLFLLECQGNGDLWINSYGGIEEVDIDGSFIVDTGHIVAFDATLEYKIKAVGGLKSTMLSGEGLVVEFSGKGKIWIQTRNIGGFVGWLTPMLPG